jgi:transketolase
VTQQEKKDLRAVMVQSFIDAVENGVFAERFPNRLINVGIAEQNLVGVATGLSLGGYVAVTANAAPFLVARANEQVKNDICYSQANVKLVGLNAGVSYGPLASTHHAIDDISIMRGLANIIILAPADPVETRKIFEFALNHTGPVYIRMDNAKFPTLHDEDYQFVLGKAGVLRQGSDITIFALGSVVHEACDAAQELQNQSIDAEVVDVSSIRPVDKVGIAESIRKTKKVITVEEHTLHGGLGSLVCEIIAEEGPNAQIVRLGITEGQFSKAGPRTDIRAYYKIDKNGIVETAKRMLADNPG